MQPELAELYERDETAAIAQEQLWQQGILEFIGEDYMIRYFKVHFILQEVIDGTVKR